jgi:hypothetical protein
MQLRRTAPEVIYEPDEPEDPKEDVPWSLHTFPEPDKKRFGKKKGVEYIVATTRMYWRADRTLAYRAGAEYRADDIELLMTEEELRP